MNDTINIATDFSRYPAGRSDEDGSSNGARFRENFLWPKLKKIIDNNSDDALTVNIDGVRTFGSSFIDEAFLGIVRHYNIQKDQLLKHLKISCNQPDLFFFRDAIINTIKQS